MKKSDLKKIIKPIVKECVQEMLIEDGVLSGVVSEVVKGLHTAPLLEVSQPEKKAAPRSDSRDRLEDQRKALMEAVSRDAYNGVDLFEGTTPMAAAGPGASAGSVDLGSPEDPGVDISSIMGQSSHIWKALK